MQNTDNDHEYGATSPPAHYRSRRQNKTSSPTPTQKPAPAATMATPPSPYRQTATAAERRDCSQLTSTGATMPPIPTPLVSPFCRRRLPQGALRRCSRGQPRFSRQRRSAPWRRQRNVHEAVEQPEESPERVRAVGPQALWVHGPRGHKRQRGVARNLRAGRRKEGEEGGGQGSLLVRSWMHRRQGWC